MKVRKCSRCGKRRPCAIAGQFGLICVECYEEVWGDVVDSDLAATDTNAGGDGAVGDAMLSSGPADE